MFGERCDVLGEMCLVRCAWCEVRCAWCLVRCAYRSDCWAPLIRHAFKPRPETLLQPTIAASIAAKIRINRRENPPAPHILL